MAETRPHGASRDAQYGFSKVFVHDLDAMAAFYEDVFGLVRFNRHQDEMFGRKIDEISFQTNLLALNAAVEAALYFENRQGGPLPSERPCHGRWRATLCDCGQQVRHDRWLA